MIVINSYAVPRSASTISLLLLRSVYEEQIEINASHDFSCSEKLQNHIIFYRDLRDCFVSSIRVYNERFDSPEFYSRLNGFVEYGELLLKAKKLEEQRNMVWYKYEETYNNLGIIFEPFEKAFGVSADINKKNEILEKYSIEKIEKISKELKNFSTWDKKTMIHGNHIGKRTVGNWKDDIPEHLKDLVNTKFQKYLRAFNYV